MNSSNWFVFPIFISTDKYKRQSRARRTFISEYLIKRALKREHVFNCLLSSGLISDLGTWHLCGWDAKQQFVRVDAFFPSFASRRWSVRSKVQFWGWWHNGLFTFVIIGRLHNNILKGTVTGLVMLTNKRSLSFQKVSPGLFLQLFCEEISLLTPWLDSLGFPGPWVNRQIRWRLVKLPICQSHPMAQLAASLLVWVHRQVGEGDTWPQHPSSFLLDWLLATFQQATLLRQAQAKRSCQKNCNQRDLIWKVFNDLPKENKEKDHHAPSWLTTTSSCFTRAQLRLAQQPPPPFIPKSSTFFCLQMLWFKPSPVWTIHDWPKTPKHNRDPFYKSIRRLLALCWSCFAKTIWRCNCRCRCRKILNSNRIMRGGLRVWRFGVEGSPDKVHAPRLGEVGSGQPVHPIAQAVAQARTDFGQVSISAAESFSTYSRETDYVDW